MHDDEVPGDEVLQVVECSVGVTTRSVAAAMGLPKDEAEEFPEIHRRR